MEPQKDQKNRKDASMTTDTSLGLGIGLSLGVLFGIVTDNIGLGMMLGVAVGLCTSPAISALKKNKKADEQEDDEKQ